MGLGPSGGSCTQPPPLPSNLADLDPMVYDYRSMDAGKGLGVPDLSRRQVLSQGMGLGPSGGSGTHPPSPLKYGGIC